jgi:DNA mismatch repair protein MutL
MPIHILAPDVAAKIAAGEVVERPANVAKELIENSIDAGATEIRVEIREGGQRLLRVTDNGYGIPAVEVPLAFHRHATSKLANAEDLNHIATFGFRGEALYSIAAVSQVTLTSRHASEEFGTQVRIEGTEIVAEGPAGAPVGTVVSVEHLFFNVPARRKFLRKPATETGRISTTIQHFAFAHPDRRFSLANEGRLVFQSSGSGDLRDVLAKIYGLENAKQMVPIGATAISSGSAGSGDTGNANQGLLAGSLDEDVDFMGGGSRTPAGETAPTNALPTDDIIRVSGYVSLPVWSRANRKEINLFINGRTIEDRNLTYAVTQAYHTLLPGGRFPVAVIQVEMAPQDVDVNVHPQKTQVRFVQDRRVFSAVQKAVRAAVVQNATIPDMPLSLDVPTTPDGTTLPAGSSGGGRPGWSVDDWATRRDAIINAGHQHPLDMAMPPTTEAIGKQSPTPSDTPADDNASVPPDGSPIPDNAQPSQAPLQERTSQLPPLRVVGQVGAMYIIAEGPEGLFLIDQHAAHERILYEKFMEQRYGMDDDQVARQSLLEPLTLHVGGELTGMVAQHLKTLNQIGFEIEPFGGDTFLVRAVPSVLSGEDPLHNLEEIVASLADRRNLVGEELEARLVKMVCKRAAIKAGQQLSDIEMQELIRQLEECKSPRTCPHGRPTMIQLSAGELEKAFGRI